MVVALWALGTVSASAQVCGDADGSGTVTVTDGVAVLRSAAGLSSSCTRTRTAVTSTSGGTTVTDGVNVLRKAAGISITESCPGGSDGTADVAKVTDVMVPFLAFALREVPSANLAAADAHPAGGTHGCENEGSRRTSQSGGTFTVTFGACQVSEAGLGSFQLDGVIQAKLGFPVSTVGFDLEVTDLGNNRVFDFHGDIKGELMLGGGFVVDGGPVSVLNGKEGPELFQLTFNELTVDAFDHLLSGSVEAEDTSDSFELATAELEVEDGSTIATLHVVRDDDSEQDYQLNSRPAT
jgi:hypothetical protein